MTPSCLVLPPLATCFHYLSKPPKVLKERDSDSISLSHSAWFPLLQVVTIAVYFFTLSLVGHQFVEPEAGAAKPREPLEPGQEPGPALGDMDMYVPLTALLQFFYAGWLKVGISGGHASLLHKDMGPGAPPQL